MCSIKRQIRCADKSSRISKIQKEIREKRRNDDSFLLYHNICCISFKSNGVNRGTIRVQRHFKLEENLPKPSWMSFCNFTSSEWRTFSNKKNKVWVNVEHLRTFEGWLAPVRPISKSCAYLALLTRTKGQTTEGKLLMTLLPPLTLVLTSHISSYVSS